VALHAPRQPVTVFYMYVTLSFCIQIVLQVALLIPSSSIAHYSSITYLVKLATGSDNEISLDLTISRAVASSEIMKLSACNTNKLRSIRIVLTSALAIGITPARSCCLRPSGIINEYNYLNSMAVAGTVLVLVYCTYI
jgi:hypothetical protein